MVWIAILVLLLVPRCPAQSSGVNEQLRQAGSLVAAGKLEEAIRIYSELVRRMPARASLRVNLAIAQYRAGLYQDAADSALRAVQLDPELAPGHLFLGASLLALDQPGPAAESLARALAANPSDRNGRMMLAEAKLALGAFVEASRHFEALSTGLAGNPRVWYGLAKSYQGLGKAGLAAAAAEKLRALPASVQSHQFAAEDLDRRGTHALAAREWREAVQLAPDDPRIKTKLVWSLYRARDYEAALPLIEELRKRTPESAELNFLHGATLLNQGLPREAIPYLETAVRLRPGLLPNRAALGQALLQSGQVQRAIPHLEAALAADEDGSSYYQLARAYRAAGMREQAQKALEGYQARQKRR